MAVARSDGGAQLLGRVDLFCELDAEALGRLAEACETVRVPVGAVVMAEGDASDALYIVVDGSFRVYTADAGGSAATGLHLLGPGDCFGEMGLITQEPRSASVRAIGAGTLVRLDRTQFLDMLAREPSVQRRLGLMLSHRLQAATQALSQRDHLLARGLDRTLRDFPFCRWRQVLEASLLEPVTERALRVRFGPDADSVAQGLAMLGVVLDQPTPALAALRARLVEHVGPEYATVLAQGLAAALAEASCWEEAISLADRYGSEAQLREIMDSRG